MNCGIELGLTSGSKDLYYTLRASIFIFCISAHTHRYIYIYEIHVYTCKSMSTLGLERVDRCKDTKFDFKD